MLYLHKSTIEQAMNYSYKYPHPAVTTDSVVFGFDGKDLHLLLIERGIEPFKGDWALPGGFIKMDETAEEGARRELFEETNVKDLFLEQFRTFSKIDRDPRERVITIAFYALVRKGDYEVIAGDDAARAHWFIIDELPPLAFDHSEIIDAAREAIKKRLRLEPIAFKLLDEKFSLTELQRLYELINGRSYDRRNFQKKMLASGYLQRMDLEESEECKMCVDPAPEAPRSCRSLNNLEDAVCCESHSDEKGSVSSEEPRMAQKPARKEKSAGRKPHIFSFLFKKFEESDDKDKDLFNP